MKPPIVKRSVVLAGHKTSVSLEDAFWRGLKAIATTRRMTLSDLIGKIDVDREQGNLSSALRPPAAKKQPAAMNPTQTRAKPPRGPSAMKAQMPPSTATLTDNASNSVMASPIDLVLRDAALT